MFAGVRHFVTGLFKSHRTFLSSEEYGKVRDNVVRTCVDCAILNLRGEMLLGKRTTEPQPDWWIIGGGMNPGESFEDAAVRNLKRELDLDVDQARLRYLNVYSFVWAKRGEPPQENGCHDASIMMVLLMSDKEVTRIQPNREYSEVRWILPEAVNECFHPAIRKIAEDLIKRRES